MTGIFACIKGTIRRLARDQAAVALFAGVLVIGAVVALQPALRKCREIPRPDDPARTKSCALPKVMVLELPERSLEFETAIRNNPCPAWLSPQELLRESATCAEASLAADTWLIGAYVFAMGCWAFALWRFRPMQHRRLLVAALGMLVLGVLVAGTVDLLAENPRIAALLAELQKAASGPLTIDPILANGAVDGVHLAAQWKWGLLAVMLLGAAIAGWTHTKGVEKDEYGPGEGLLRMSVVAAGIGGTLGLLSMVWPSVFNREMIWAVMGGMVFGPGLLLGSLAKRAWSLTVCASTAVNV